MLSSDASTPTTIGAWPCGPLIVASCAALHECGELLTAPRDLPLGRLLDCAATPRRRRRCDRRGRSSRPGRVAAGRGSGAPGTSAPGLAALRCIVCQVRSNVRCTSWVSALATPPPACRIAPTRHARSTGTCPMRLAAMKSTERGLPCASWLTNHASLTQPAATTSRAAATRSRIWVSSASWAPRRSCSANRRRARRRARHPTGGTSVVRGASPRATDNETLTLCSLPGIRPRNGSSALADVRYASLLSRRCSLRKLR